MLFVLQTCEVLDHYYIHIFSGLHHKVLCSGTATNIFLMLITHGTNRPYAMFHLVNDIHMKQLLQTSFSIMLSCQELEFSIWSTTFFYAYTLCFVKVCVLLSFEVFKLLHFICIFFLCLLVEGLLFVTMCGLQGRL